MPFTKAVVFAASFIFALLALQHPAARGQVLVRREIWSVPATGPASLVESGQTLSFASDTPFTVHVNTYNSEAQQYWTVLHVYDQASVANAAPASSLGPMRVAVDFSGRYDRNFAIFIAGGASNFNPRPQALGSGVVNVTSLQIFGEDNLPDLSARDATKLIARISGDLLDDGGDVEDFETGVSVGEIYRFQALGRTLGDGVTFAGGSLLGNMRAIKEITPVLGALPADDLVFASIRDVTFGRRMLGSLTAVAGGIDRLQVGTAGVDDCYIASTARIRSGNGTIGRVNCSGPIGQELFLGSVTEISAGNCIRQIRSNVSTVNGVIVNGDIHAQIRAGEIITYADAAAAEFTSLGSIGLVETKGNFDGGIVAKNIGGLAQGDAPVAADGRAGINVRGQIDGVIDVDWNLSGADIIASKIPGNITIRNQAQGSIVAYGPISSTEGFTMGDVTIGRGRGQRIDAEHPVLPDDERYQLTQRYPPGFVGGNVAPLDRARFTYEGQTEPRSEEDIWFNSVAPTYGSGAKDSVIFAAGAIRNVDIYQTHQTMEVDAVSGFGTRAAYKPRIETPIIIKKLEIDELSAGVLWSGKMLYQTAFEQTPSGPVWQQRVATSPSDYYVAVSTAIRLGNVAPPVDLYLGSVNLAGYSLQFPSLDIKNDLLGELHLPRIPVYGAFVPRVVIGHKLGSVVEGDACAIEPAPVASTVPSGADTRWATSASDEKSPRGHALRLVFDPLQVGTGRFVRIPEPTNALRGAVRIYYTHGLNGDIVVNARAGTGPGLNGELTSKHTDTLLNGQVWIGEESSSPLVMGRFVFSDPSLQLPRYTALPSTLGPGVREGEGGAVGLVPFALHRAACFPPLTGAPGPVVPYVFFAQAGSEARARLQFYCRLQVSPSSVYGTVSAKSLLGELYQPTDLRAEASTDFKGVYFLPPLTSEPKTFYKLEFDRAIQGNVFSDNICPVWLPGTNNDLYFSTIHGCLGVNGQVNPADVNQDGIVDGDDWLAFLNSYSLADPMVDSTADVAGGLGPQDPDGSYHLPPGFEYLPDGIIDGNDFSVFVNAFTAGC